MRDFRSNRGGGFRGNRFGGGRRNDRGGDRPMHDAVCSNCGRDCQVPFRPTGEKPVLCSDCFSEQRDSQPRGAFERRERPRASAPVDMSNDFAQLNKKLDTILDIVLNMKKELKKSSSRTVSVSELVGEKEPEEQDLL